MDPQLDTLAISEKPFAQDPSGVFDQLGPWAQ
jgi:hypothetical protein